MTVGPKSVNKKGGETTAPPDGKVSILMPAYNEGDHIYNNIRETGRVLAGLFPDYEIVVADDGSRDNTRSEIERAAGSIPRVRWCGHAENLGKGWALKSAFAISSGTLIFFLDSDLDIHPRQFSTLLRVQTETGADVVIGSKRHPQSTLHYPRSRRIISSAYFFLVKFLFGLPIRDTQTGIKLFRREVLKSILPRIVVKQYAFDLELLVNAHRRGFSIAEAPVVVDYKGKFGRIGLRPVWTILTDTLAVYYRWKVLRYYDRTISWWERTPRVSIIVPCRGPTPHLVECLRGIAALDYPDYEVLVLPNEEFDPGLPGVRVLPTGPVSPPRKRDAGAAAATGEIIAFIDDDAYPRPDWLRNAVRHFGDETLAAVGGPASTPPSDGSRESAGGRVLSCLMVGGVHAYRSVPQMLKEVDDYPTSNLLVRRSDFLTAGGFDTPYWPGEDTVLCLKLTKGLGKRILYDPDVQVFHHRRPLFLPHLRQIGNYGRHRGYFVKKFPETSRRPSYFLPSLWTGFLLLGWLPLSFIPGGLIFYLGVIASYFIAALLTALRSFNFKATILVLSGIISTHVVYGVQFVRGLLSRKLPEE